PLLAHGAPRPAQAGRRRGGRRRRRWPDGGGRRRRARGAGRRPRCSPGARAMSLGRSLLFENPGLKFTAVLLAVLVYFNAFTDRPAKETVSFPIALQDLPDSLAIAGPVPREVVAEVHGLGKPVLRMKYFPPAITISLASVRAGHFERSLNAADLPLPSG